MDILYLYDFTEIELLDIENEKQIKANINITFFGKEELKFKEPLKFDLTISRKGYKFLFNGNIEASITLQCDRCLEEFEYSINTKFNFMYISNEDTMEYISGSVLNLKDLIFGEVYLNIPFKKLCKIDCKGLCSQCGENLNNSKCKCRAVNVNSPFAKLKTIYN
jgi:uncharacterized protein